jgi:type II secretory pathway pseudopilin PulG
MMTHRPAFNPARRSSFSGRPLFLAAGKNAMAQYSPKIDRILPPLPGGEGRGEGEPWLRSPGTQAFTMIEIAISLAIIGFAMVAIIGILPLGMDAQRDNRQETIINQDASVLMDALRNGEKGLDDLTNYVIGITNYSAVYSLKGRSQTHVSGYTTKVSTFDGAASTPQFPLTNGYNIIGLLSTPKLIPNGNSFISNHVIGVFRSLSGPASEKPPQINSLLQDLSLTYRVIADVSSYSTNYFDTLSTNYNYSGPGPITNEPTLSLWKNYILVTNLQLNVHDVRLTFLWPVLPNGKLSDKPNRQVYRTMVSGHLTNDPPFQPFFFFQPRTYF